MQGMDGMITKGWEKIRITKAFTPNFEVETTEANALAPHFTFIPKVEKYNDEKDNESNPTNSIIMVIENCLQPSHAPFRMATISGCASTSSNVKVSQLNRQVGLKQKKLN